MRDDAHCVGGRAELGAAIGDARDRAGLDGQGHLVRNALLGGDVGNLFRSAGTKVDDRIRRQLHGRAAGDDFLGVHRDGRDGVHRNAEFAGQRAVIRHAEALHVFLLRADDDRIHINTRNRHQLRIERAALHDLFDLHDDLAARVLARLRHRGHVQRADLAVYGAVAVFVAVGSAQEYDIDREALIQQALLPLDVDDLDQILLGHIVELAAAVARVGKGLEADVGDRANVVRRDIAVHMRNNALRQVVRLDLVGQRQLSQTGRAVPVAANDALYHALVAVVVAAGAVAVALAGREEQRQIVRMAGLQKALFQRLGQGLRTGAGDEAAGGDRVAVLYFQGGLFCRDNAYFLHVLSSSSE